MISAIVLASEARVNDDIVHARETVVKSLVWLVSAVVSGVVRHVTLATPAGLGLSTVADQAGCDLVQAESERDRLIDALKATREPLILILRAGFQPEAGLIDEIDAFVRRGRADANAIILAYPESSLHRLFPSMAPVVGILAPSDQLKDATITSFDRLARRLKRGLRFRARAVRIA